MARRLTTALLCLGAIALAATTSLGSPWPGVVLCGLSAGVWAWEVRGESNAKAAAETSARVAALEAGFAKAAEATAERISVAEHTIGEHAVQINSLRNAVSMRGTFGG